jgi:nucleoside-diphosphate-sugar epimerase
MRRIVVVTGAGGFIGSPVVAALLKLGIAVRAHRGPPGFVGRALPASVEVANAEITDGSAMRSIVAESDAVIHLAGPPSVRDSFDDAAAYAAAHVVGTTVCLQACVDQGVRRFVYVSSADVYGRPQSARVVEHHPLSARSPYAAAKVGAEQMVGAFAHAHGIEAVILRPFSIYGPGLSHRSLLWTILDQARGHDEIVLDDLKPERDYCFVDDLAEAVVRAISATVESPLIVNIGTGIGTSVADLARLALKAIGREANVVERSRDKRPGNAEIFRLVADPRKAQASLGWESSVDLAAGLRKTIDAPR